MVTTHQSIACSLRRQGPTSIPVAAVLTVLLSLTAPAHGGTLLEIYQAAVTNDAQLQATRSGNAVTRQDMLIARSAMLPSASVGAYTERIHRNLIGAQLIDNDAASDTFGQAQSIPIQQFTQQGYNGRITQPLLAAETWFTYRSAQAVLAQGDLNVAAAEQNLIVRVADAYLNVLRAHEGLESAIAQEVAFARQLDQVKQRFDVGLVAVTDVLDAQAAYDQAQVAHIQAAGDLDIVFQSLAVLTGTPHQQVARFEPRLPIVYPSPRDPDRWADIAVNQNFQVLGAQKAVEAARKQLKAKKAARAPTVTAQVGYNYFATGGPAFLGNTIGEGNVRLNVSLPIYQGGRLAHQGRRSQAQLRQAEQNLELQRRTVTRDARSLFRAASNGVDRVRARARAVRSAQSALEATRTGYEVGTRNIVDVLQAEQRFVQSQFDFADARYSYVLDSLRLLSTSGSLQAGSIESLNKHIDPKDIIDRSAATANFPTPSGSAGSVVPGSGYQWRSGGGATNPGGSANGTLSPLVEVGTLVRPAQE